eukprot:170267-Amphidinium_carterae.6
MQRTRKSTIRTWKRTVSTQSESTARPVIQHLTGQVTITNFYATPGQAFQLPTIDDSNEMGTRPIATITNSAAESTT